MPKYYVYIHRRNDTGQVFYVGKGSGNRYKDIWSRNDWWNAIVRKHGFTHHIVKDGMNEACANIYERILINIFRSRGAELCNITDGGDGVRHPNLSARIPVVCSNGMEFRSAAHAADWAGVTSSRIASVCRGERKTSSGYTWWYKGDSPKEYECPKSRMGRPKVIYCSNGMTFDSILDAASWCGGHSGNIVKCAAGEIESAYGYAWSHEYIPEQPIDRYKRAGEKMGKPVVCSNGMVFKSSKEASRWVKSLRGSGSETPIANCCKGRSKSAYGFTWEYQ